MPRYQPWLIALCLLLFWASPVGAHAVLTRAEPAPNSAIAQTPAAIRLWFTEPLEARFSSLQLRDSGGVTIAIPESQIDSADAKQLVVQPGDLPEGLYTVVWRVVSAADGHHTEGSFPFTVGATAVGSTVAAALPETIPWSAALLRWINLIGLTLAVGSLGFVLWVWQPAQAQTATTVAAPLQTVIWIGWLLLGVGGVLILLLQTATVTGLPWWATVTDPALGQVLTTTRFGSLWLARLALWVLLGGTLWFSRSRPALRWLALLLGTAILLLHSLYSHAAAAQAPVLAVINHWFHLLMTALWLGGLVQFFVGVGLLRRSPKTAVTAAGRLTGYFSNYARIAVAGLAISGLYSAWLHVGSLTGLQTTLYGRQLLIKLLLFVPLLILATVNLLVTQQRLQARQTVWVGRLRGLIGAELVLALAILTVVGIMTAISPARTTLAERTLAAALVAKPPPQPITAMEMLDNLHVELAISPGWVGENTFRVTLLSAMEDGQPITDASLIRLRFAHQTEDLGESELRITSGQNGVYTVQGANLSIPGDWQIRLTIQRPDQFDTVVDFVPQVTAQPPPPPPPVIDTTLPPATQLLALLILGLLALVLGGYALGQHGLRPRSGPSLLASTLTLLGILFLASAALT